MLNTSWVDLEFQRKRKRQTDRSIKRNNYHDPSSSKDKELSINLRLGKTRVEKQTHKQRKRKREKKQTHKQRKRKRERKNRRTNRGREREREKTDRKAIKRDHKTNSGSLYRDIIH